MAEEGQSGSGKRIVPSSVPSVSSVRKHEALYHLFSYPIQELGRDLKEIRDFTVFSQIKRKFLILF